MEQVVAHNWTVFHIAEKLYVLTLITNQDYLVTVTSTFGRFIDFPLYSHLYSKAFRKFNELGWCGSQKMWLIADRH